MSKFTVMQEYAIWWVDRFFWPVPAHPGTKRLFAGYGPYLNQVHSATDIKQWFGSNKTFNMAVTAYGGGLILDFDDRELYSSWSKYHNLDGAQTYTELTPRGGAHVFFYKQPFTEIPEGIKLKPGVEIKKCVMVAPSIVDGNKYSRGMGEILEVDAVNIFVGLTVPGTPTPYLLNVTNKATLPEGQSIIPKIKQSLPVQTILKELLPKTRVSGTGRWLSGRCPFHDDKKPSFWIDSKRNLFGCHGCGEHGDVINLFAKLKGITVNEAIDQLRDRVQL